MPADSGSPSEPSSLPPSLKAVCEGLRARAAERISDYSLRLSRVNALYDGVLRHLIVSNFSTAEAYETALKFFGGEEVRFAGIDGTRYSSPLMDLVIFFGGAYASMGTIRFRADGPPEIEYEDNFLDKGVSISTVVPLFINEIPEVDQTYFSFDPEGTPVSHPLADQWFVDNSMIANSMMTFAEYYLAYRLITDPSRRVKVLFMDRSLSGERTSLLYDTSKPSIWKRSSSLLGFEVEGVKIDERDLAYGRYYVVNEELNLPPPRGDYLPYAIIHLLEGEGPLDLRGICERLGIEELDRVSRVERYLKSSKILRRYLDRRGIFYSLKPRYRTTWRRLRRAVEVIGERLFSYRGGEGEKGPVMRIKSGGRMKWLTTLDLSFLTLFCLQMIVEECWRRRVLLIGLTKDTAARDFKRQFLPIMANEGLLKGEIKPRNLEALPNTDRMILQVVSMSRAESISVPWSLVEYDSCFKTLIPDRGRRKGYVKGARRNKISLERLFLKSYIQLSQAESNPRLRSNVLLMDRLIYPEFDLAEETLVRFWNEFSGAKEPVEVILYRDNSVRNPLQNLVMVILSSMVCPSIPEVFGHNKPLFIADKIAKWNYGYFKRIVDGTRNWILNNRKLKEFLFYMGSFRERRSLFEAARRG
ncbi:hypothetical protein CW700_02545 [Candidatus Bathyarchaeota archaeon]|nr:MAG: hypothetical protein CW700_02545 [Candidatus Bathyarchaeota archaeon]